MSKEKAPPMAMKIMIKGEKKERPKKQWMELVEEEGCQKNRQRKKQGWKHSCKQ